MSLKVGACFYWGMSLKRGDGIDLLAGFPFRILGFHADSGSEYINHKVAKVLDKLSAAFTKSRPPHSNDNGLAETKNGAVIRYETVIAPLFSRFPFFSVSKERQFNVGVEGRAVGKQSLLAERPSRTNGRAEKYSI